MDIEEIENLEFVKERIIKIEDIFQDKQDIILDSKKLEMFLNGVKLKVKLNNGIYRIYNTESNFIGLGEVKTETLKRDVIL